MAKSSGSFGEENSADASDTAWERHRKNALEAIGLEVEDDE